MESITIPDPLFKRAKQIAKVQNRDLNDVVSEALAQGLPSIEKMAPQLDLDKEKEKAAYQRLHSNLWQQYPNQFVAILNGNLVDHDDDKPALLNRIQQQYPETFVLIRQVLKEPEIIYQHRSVRW